jgi:hypothetical protein
VDGEGDSCEGQMRAIDDRRREDADEHAGDERSGQRTSPVTEISAQRAACATMPAAIGHASRRLGIEKKVPNEVTAHPLTVLSMIGVNRAAAFNRDRQRDDILNAGFETLFELNTTALILDEALSTRHAERVRRVYRVVATSRLRKRSRPHWCETEATRS